MRGALKTASPALIAGEAVGPEAGLSGLDPPAGIMNTPMMQAGISR